MQLKLQFLSFFSHTLLSRGCWVKATTVAGMPRIAEGGEGQQDLHVGWCAPCSAVSVNHSLACGAEAVSSCMPVVRVWPPHPQLFSVLFLLVWFPPSFSLFMSYKQVLKMQFKHTGGNRWERNRFSIFTPSWSTWKLHINSQHKVHFYHVENSILHFN